LVRACSRPMRIVLTSRATTTVPSSIAALAMSVLCLRAHRVARVGIESCKTVTGSSASQRSTSSAKERAEV
jgi:hypothetical protein